MSEELWQILLKALPQILKAGIQMTIPLTLLSFVTALVIAVIAALIQYAKVPVLKQIMQFYVWLIRGTPLLVQLMIIFYGLPMVGIHADPFWAAWAGFSFCEGAYMAEALRGCLEGVPEGQKEAGLCVGMSFGQIMWHIVLPQAFRTDLLSRCLDEAVKDGCMVTDDASAVELYGNVRVRAVTGSYANFKITTPEDLR